MTEHDPNKGFGEIPPLPDANAYDDENRLSRTIGRTMLTIGLCGSYFNFLDKGNLSGAEGLVGLASLGGTILLLNKLGSNLPEEDDKNGLERAVKAVRFSGYI